MPVLFTTMSSLSHLFFVGPASGGSGEIVVVAFDGGAIVVDPQARTVRRSYGSGVVTARYLRWRRVFTAHVAAPDFSVADGGSAVIEEFVDGRHLLDVEPFTRILAVEMLLRAFAELTRAAGVRGDDFASSARDALQTAQLPEAFLRRWEVTRTRWLDESVPWVPSAFEATAKNLVVRADGTPSPIDLGDLAPAPYLLYPIGIVCAAGPEVLSAFVHGRFDAALADLFAAAGVSWVGAPEQRAGLLLVRLVWAAAREAMFDGEIDVAAFSASVSRRWHELAPVLAAAEGREEARVNEPRR